MQGQEGAIELFHDYTYSGDPAACAAGIATLDIYESEGLLTRATGIQAEWDAAVHSLKGLAHVTDFRTIGLIAGIELASRDGAVGARAYAVFVDCFEKDLLIRITGDIIALSPPLVIQTSEIVETLGNSVTTAA